VPRITALLVALAVLLPSAAAASDGPRAVHVTADSVTIRDLLPAGDLRPAEAVTDGVGEDVLDRVLLTGLAPGEQRILTPAEIRLRLAEVGVDPSAGGWSWPHSLIITRLSQVVSTDDLIAAGERAIRAQLDLLPGDAATIAPVTSPRPLLAPIGDLTLDALVRPPQLRGGLWIADIAGICDGRPAFDCTLRYRVRLNGPVLVARRPLRRGDALSPDDVVRQVRDISSLRARPLRTDDDLLGSAAGGRAAGGRGARGRAARAVSAGTILTDEVIEPIPAVRRGEPVTATARIGAVCATARVLALADGAVGDTIRVRTDGQRKEFLVRVSGPGRAEVILSQ